MSSLSFQLELGMSTLSLESGRLNWTWSQCLMDTRRVSFSPTSFKFYFTYFLLLFFLMLLLSFVKTLFLPRSLIILLLNLKASLSLFLLLFYYLFQGPQNLLALLLRLWGDQFLSQLLRQADCLIHWRWLRDSIHLLLESCKRLYSICLLNDRLKSCVESLLV